MIIRRLETSHQLITQPDHAALACRIMRAWHADHFPETARKPSILHAVEEHDIGWAGVDESLVIDEETGQLLDFIQIPTPLKLETSRTGIERLASDPYAAALVAQHRVHVYRRYADHPEWRAFFAEVIALRAEFLREAGSPSLEELRRDYAFVRAGDLASLTFCTIDDGSDPEGCAYAMRITDEAVTVTPDPFGGQEVPIEIRAREIAPQSFGSAECARRAVAEAPTVTLRGTIKGARMTLQERG